MRPFLFYAVEGTMPDANKQEQNTPEDKNTDEQKMYGEAVMVEQYDSGPISFTELQQMQEAEEAAMKLHEMSYQFPKMVRRIFHREDIENKDAALTTLANEFVDFAREALNKEIAEDKVAEVGDHYKEVEQFAEKATDEDFQGGCPNCGFGEKELLKEECPYCGAEINES